MACVLCESVTELTRFCRPETEGLFFVVGDVGFLTGPAAEISSQSYNVFSYRYIGRLPEYHYQ